MFAILLLAANITVAVHPERVYIESFPHAQALNFDFEIRNEGTLRRAHAASATTKPEPMDTDDVVVTGK